MPFKPGISGNPTGRPKGAKNRITVEVRELLGQFVRKELADLENLSDQLEPRDRARLLVGVLPYVLPKAQGAETSTSEEPLVITLDLGTPEGMGSKKRANA